MGSLTFQFEGRAYQAEEGDSVASALATVGEETLGTRRSTRPRGTFCGMGVCHDCLVTIDGHRGQRACMTTLQDGMSVYREDEGHFGDRVVTPDPGTEQSIETDIAIIGAGPAGLTAALCSAKAGADVVVLDERGEPGGQYFKPRSSSFRGRQPLDRQHRRGDALRDRVRATGAQILAHQSVWYARRHEGDGKLQYELRSLHPTGRLRVRAQAVILATGAYERPAMVPGWTLPGVMTIGAAQTFARRYGVVPGSRSLIAGHGPLGLQLANEVQTLGGNIVALAERGKPGVSMALVAAAFASPRLVTDGAQYRIAAMRAGIPFMSGWELAKVLGDDRVAGAQLREIATGRTKQFDVDSVFAGDGFAPQLELARLLDVPLEMDSSSGSVKPQRADDGSTPVDGVWIAGDAGGLGGAELALSQGELSARSALEFLGRKPTGDASLVRRSLRSARRFQAALWSMYHAPQRELPAGETILCRCEEVTTEAAQAAISTGAHDPAVLKRQTRVGMGRCQGRYCVPQVLRLLEAAGHTTNPQTMFAPQIPARPVSLGRLALEKPEWGGHRESPPAQRPSVPTNEPLGVDKADLVIIGGGITGISAALYAARSGASVVCLERGRVNGEASGGNAGSLHLQLLSWDFGGKAVGDGSLQLHTLPLQKESIDLWRDLQSELNADFEMSVTGGLMVAENTEQITFLEAKAAAEARVGIHTEVIDGNRVREIAPAISEDIVAAAWCPGEGKINPLAATPLLAKAAQKAGAHIEEHAPVDAIHRQGKRYVVKTPRGMVCAPRILIAAGGWSTQIGQMLGVSLPIRGAPLQMVVTAPGPPIIPCLLAHADRHLSMKQAASGSVILGGAWPAATSGNGFGAILPDSLEGNLWVAARTVPNVASLHVIRSWAAMNIDIDGAPLIGAVPGMEGVTVAATANGYTLGPLMGREAAAAALQGRSRQDLNAFSFDRFNAS